MGGGDDDVSIENPGTVDLSKSNPEAYAQMKYLRDMRDNFDISSMNAMDPAKYNARRDDSMARNETAIQNRFAGMGLAGSSLAMGAAAESDRQNGFAWDDRMMSDMGKSIAIKQGLTGDITGDIFKIQGQFGDYQTQKTNAEIAQQNAENEMWGNIMKLGGTLGGAAIAGPVGAGAGGAAAGAAAPGQTASIPYNSPTYSQDLYSGGGTYGYGSPAYYGYGGSY